MLEIKLVNMPFAAKNVPSIGLTQLKSVLDASFGDRVSVEILYLNQDFIHYLMDGKGSNTRDLFSLHDLFDGFGDWFFRQVAFPETTDNSNDYFARFYPRSDERSRHFRNTMSSKRQGLDRFLEGLIDRDLMDRAAIVGFSSLFAQNVASFAMARKLKQRNPRIVTVIGGANCEAPMGHEIARHVECIDYVFSGPALRSFPEFVRCHLEDRLEAREGIRGVFSKARPEPPPEHQFGEELDIDATVELDYDSFLESVERTFPDADRPPILFETSRGCWWGQRAHCTFCGLNGSSIAYRAMSPENAVRQFESLFSRYSARSSCLFAVDAIMPKRFVNDVFPLLDPPPGAAVLYEVKNDLSERDLEIMARAGVTAIQPGIESFNTSSLKRMKKGTTSFQNVVLLKHCLRHDVVPYWNLLLGFPGETEEVYAKYVRDLPLLSHLPPPSGAHQVRFDRYSPYFVKSEEYGLDLQPFDFYRLVYPFNDDVIRRLAYYFMDRNFVAPYFLAMAKWIGKVRAATLEWIRRWSVSSGARPKLYGVPVENGLVVHDSRAPETVEHRLDEADTEILGALDAHGNAEQLTARLTDRSVADLEAGIRRLSERGLLFEEQGRYLSLVLQADHKVTPRPAPDFAP